MMSCPRRVLIAEDETNSRWHLTSIFEAAGFEVAAAPGAVEARDKADQFGPHLVVADVSLPGLGSDLVASLTADPRASGDEPPPVIVVASRSETAAALAALRAGAAGYLSRPLCRDEVLMVAERALERRALIAEAHRMRARLSECPPLRTLVGTSPAMQEVRAILAQAVTIPTAPVLVAGESGTGKSLVAELVHRTSDRRTGPLVRVVCRGRSPGEAATELFDDGALAAADRGTLLIEEITELDGDTQLRLAAALGGQAAGRPDDRDGRARQGAVRLVATASLDPQRARASGQLVAQLHDLVRGIVVALPPLRQRRTDIPLLAHWLLHGGAAPDRAGSPGSPGSPGFTSDALARLLTYDWPGNVRELNNAVVRAASLAGSHPIEGRHLGVALVPDATGGRRVRGSHGPGPSEHRVRGSRRRRPSSPLSPGSSSAAEVP